MKEPEFLELDDVLDLHERQLAEFGGSSGLRDRGILESAVAMPQASFGEAFVHESVFAMAAAYAFHVAENQPSWTGTSARASARRSSFFGSTATGSLNLMANSSTR